MNKTAIEWCDYTWNPVTGCRHGCQYCYARKIAERFKGSKAWPQGFEPMLHHERLNDPAKMKKPQTIFVCSMADLFGSWVPKLWTDLVFDACLQAPQHTYIFLTKNPSRYLFIPGSYLGQKNFWFGATATGGDRPSMARIDSLQKLPEGNTFISFEPLLGNPGPLDLTGIKQVIIGAQTNPFVLPPEGAITTIVREAARVGAKRFFKDSLNGISFVGGSTFTNNRDLCWNSMKAGVREP